MSGALIVEPNLDDADGFYAELVAAHNGLTDAASALMNARLALILANHIGDRAVLREALARAGAGDPAAPPSE